VASTPQTSSTTQSSSEVTEPPFIDPTPRSKPQTTAGSSSGGERRSGREKRPTAKKKDMPNQDLQQQAFAVQINDGNDIINPDTTPLAYAFYTAATKTYGHQDDFPPPPKSWKEMLNHKYTTEFKAAAHTEIRALTRKQTWDKVRLIGKVHRLPTIWVFTYKEDSDGFITRFKACLVVRGDLQAVSQEEVKAITAAYRTFRLLYALIASFDLDVIQINAVNAFINALVDNKVYLIPPKGIDLPPRFSLRLRKAMYGLRKSPKLWFLEMSAALQSIGLKVVPNKPCLYVHPTKPIFIFFYVDDILIIGHLSCY